MGFSVLVGCTGDAPSGDSPDPEPQDSTPQDSSPQDSSSVDRGPWTTPPPSVVDGPERLVAFADVHGDLDATRNVLRLAGLIDDTDQWIGGETVVVQTGDQLDRGDGERAILDLFESLSQQAWDAK